MLLFGAAVAQQQCYVCESGNPITECDKSETCSTQLGYCFSVYNSQDGTGKRILMKVILVLYYIYK